MPDPRRLRTLVEIQQITVPEDHILKTAAKWEKFAAGWFGVRPQPGTEPEAGRQQQTENVMTLVGHWTPQMAAVKTTMRAVIEGRILEIRSAVDVMNMHREIELVLVDRGKTLNPA